MFQKFDNFKKNYYLFQEYLKKELSKPDLTDTFGSQKGQVDFLINNIFDYENKGLPYKKYFVDCAAGDAITYSNTYFLESYLGWKGLLIEPNPIFHKDIEEKRSSKLIKQCIGSNDGDILNFRVDNRLLGGLVGDEFDNNKKNRKEELESAEIIKVETKTLTTVLSENNSPNNIDYLSLDVEGAEEFILKNFDFEKYTFRFITVERPSDTLNILLDKNGYIQIKSIESESFYTHKSYFKSVNLKPNINFKLTKRKDW